MQSFRNSSTLSLLWLGKMPETPSVTLAISNIFVVPNLPGTFSSTDSRALHAEELIITDLYHTHFFHYFKSLDSQRVLEIAQIWERAAPHLLCLPSAHWQWEEHARQWRNLSCKQEESPPTLPHSARPLRLSDRPEITRIRGEESARLHTPEKTYIVHEEEEGELVLWPGGDRGWASLFSLRSPPPSRGQSWVNITLSVEMASFLFAGLLHFDSRFSFCTNRGDRIFDIDLMFRLVAHLRDFRRDVVKMIFLSDINILDLHRTTSNN